MAFKRDFTFGLYLIFTFLAAVVASVFAVKADRAWEENNEALEGCRYWCYAHVKYDTPDKYVDCIRECKEAIE